MCFQPDKAENNKDTKTQELLQVVVACLTSVVQVESDFVYTMLCFFELGSKKEGISNRTRICLI